MKISVEDCEVSYSVLAVWSWNDFFFFSNIIFAGQSAVTREKYPSNPPSPLNLMSNFNNYGSKFN